MGGGEGLSSAVRCEHGETEFRRFFGVGERLCLPEDVENRRKLVSPVGEAAIYAVVQ